MGDLKIIGILSLANWVWILMCWVQPSAEEVIIICKRILMNILCVFPLWWKYCIFRQLVLELMVHLNSCPPPLLLLFAHYTSKELLPGWRERVQKSYPVHDGKHPTASSSGRHVVSFLWFSACSFEQEVQQQLIIEMRNMKKTRNFYQKLKNQQERKNKGLCGHCNELWTCFLVFH